MRNSSAVSKPHRNRRSRPMLRKSALLSAAMVLVLGLAAAYMGQNNLKDAETALKQALTFDDKYVPAHTMLAILEWRIDRLQEADKEFRAAIALDPSNGDTNNNYGKFLCETGKQQDAM